MQNPNNKELSPNDFAEYIILKSKDPLKLSEQVKRFRKHGWIEQGGVAVASCPTTGVGYFIMVYAQAMVENKKEERHYGGQGF